MTFFAKCGMAALLTFGGAGIVIAQQPDTPGDMDSRSGVRPPGLGPGVLPIICTMEYAPVCGRGRDGIWRTYPNACHAHRENVVEIVNGPCR